MNRHRIIKPALIVLLLTIAHLVASAQARRPSETKALEDTLSSRIGRIMNSIDWSHTPLRVTGDTILYTIPVVVHILHDYGTTDISDSEVYAMLDTANLYFLKLNPDTLNIIPKFKPVASSTGICFKLANIDPNGQPTHGIEHNHTYLTNNARDQSKINQWDPMHYLNIWIVASIFPDAGFSLTGLTFPIDEADAEPYYDGILFTPDEFLYTRKILVRLIGKYLALLPPCEFSGCVDYDHIPDTPPCNGDSFSCANLYQSVCDTPNIQNLMMSCCTYISCHNMFTFGQGIFMQSVLQNDLAKRDSLVTPNNFVSTGMGQQQADLPPIADFSSSFAWEQPENRFAFPGSRIYVQNFSWNDTIVGSNWTITDGDTTYVSTNALFNYYYISPFVARNPGWVTTSLTVTGNNTGTNTRTDSFSVFVADSAPTGGYNYIQEFSDPVSLAQWPMFNYFNNNFKWQISDVGYDDNASMMYYGFDDRTAPATNTGTPVGDIDDFFTPAFDLSGFSDSCYLNFVTSGASRSTNPRDWNDSLQIFYCVGKNTNFWTWLGSITGADLASAGVTPVPWYPSFAAAWVPHSFAIPPTARVWDITFRFRYLPGGDSVGLSTGNNFFIDKINFNQFPQGVVDQMLPTVNACLYPNPSTGSSAVYIKNSVPPGSVVVSITDMTGRCIGSIQQELATSVGIIQLPTYPPGIYLVHLSWPGSSQTLKWIVR